MGAAIVIFSFLKNGFLPVDIIQAVIQLLLCVLLLQSWIPIREYYFAYNAVGWYLSVMVFLYFLEPLLIKVAAKLKIHEKYIIGIILFNLLVLLTFAFKDTKLENWVLYISPFTRAIEYFIGIITGSVFAYKYNKNNGDEKSIRWSILEVLSVTGIVLALSANVPKYLSQLIWFIPFAIFIIWIFSNGRGILTKVFSNKITLYVADVSFIIYITHQIIFRYVWLLNEYILKLDDIEIFGIGLCMAVSVVPVFEGFKRIKSKNEKQNIL